MPLGTGVYQANPPLGHPSINGHIRLVARKAPARFENAFGESEAQRRVQTTETVLKLIILITVRKLL